MSDLKYKIVGTGEDTSTYVQINYRRTKKCNAEQLQNKENNNEHTVLLAPEEKAHMQRLLLKVIKENGECPVCFDMLTLVLKYILENYSSREILYKCTICATLLQHPSSDLIKIIYKTLRIHT
jgi:hypothetical protein